MTTGKRGPSDGANYPQEGDDEQDEEYKKKKSLKKDEKYNEELEKLEEAGEQAKERRKEGIKQYEKKETDTKKQVRKKGEEIKIGGQKVKPKKVYSHEKGMGVFIRNRTKLGKIKNGLRKVRGLSVKEKKLFPEIAVAYNPEKIVFRKDKLKKLLSELRRLKSGGRGGTDFKRLEKTFDKDFLKKTFSNKRKINRIGEVLFGKESHKHKMKQSSNRNPGAGKSGSTSPSRIKRF